MGAQMVTRYLHRTAWGRQQAFRRHKARTVSVAHALLVATKAILGWSPEWKDAVQDLEYMS